MAYSASSLHCINAGITYIKTTEKKMSYFYLFWEGDNDSMA
ncbi:hypothetical protein PPEP_b0721 [Pseudoalteromonas peptidolytica F12-50-A1]|uniref:Uncharacterized protein n=1 Tax=Pseudoalteromonas peptidolytica F12-50-A1 TaxID=1315280 RepID=A0A8I0N0X0_9GAMM|nr:hypothetical protein [Pseudoalteromonas peptidolytica F12-50-A1]